MSQELATTSDNLPSAAMSFETMQALAESVAKSGLFGCKTPDAALTLMMLAQAENMHPIQAMRMYHIIEGKPSMRADAMQAKFQQAGGKIKWLQRTDEVVEAEFSHPTIHPDPLRVRWDNAKVQQAGLGGNHRKYPVAMKSARVVSEGVRAVMPQVVLGLYTPEEVEDFNPPTEPREPRQQKTAVKRVDSKPVETAAEPEQITEQQVKEAAFGRGITPAEFEKGFAEMLKGMNVDTIHALPNAARQKILDGINCGRADHWKTTGPDKPTEPDPTETIEEAVAKLTPDQFKTRLREHSVPHGINRPTFDKGLAAYLGNRALADLSTAERVELLELIAGNVFDYATGKPREAVPGFTYIGDGASLMELIADMKCKWADHCEECAAY
jgi:hypothetical protein